MAAMHDELVAEMSMAEKLPMLERLKMAKKRRAQQLKAYAQYEKQLNKETGSSKKSKKLSSGDGAPASPVKTAKENRRLQFTGSILLLDAAAKNDIAEVKNLLDMGVSPDASNEDGLTTLHQCCIDGLEEMMLLLLERGANVDARDSELWTPLHAAATCGHEKLCRYLCDHGANLLAVNADGNMPYDLCEDVKTLDYIESEMAKRGVTQELIDETRVLTENKMLSDVQNLVNDSGDVNCPGVSGETCLHIAACNGYTNVAEYLLMHGAKVNVADNDGWQPVHCAVCWGQLNLVKILLEHGADIDARTKNGETALDLCDDIELRQGVLEIIDEIQNNISRGVSVNATSLQHRNSSLRRSNTAISGIHLQRRTSLLEKDPIAAKDRQNEAQIFQEMMSLGTTSDIDDDEEGSSANGNIKKAEVAASDINVSINDGDSRALSTAGGSTVTVSTTPQSESRPVSSPVPSSPTGDDQLLASLRVSYVAATSPSLVNGNATAAARTTATTSSVVNGSATEQHPQHPAVSVSLANGSLAAEAPRPSGKVSLADLKKQRAKERQEQLNRRRGSDTSNDRPVVSSNGYVEHSSPAKLSTTGNTYSVRSYDELTDDGLGGGTRRKHSNRYDLVMPDKKHDHCCITM